MPGKITFEIVKGELAGQTFEYEEADRVFVGRQEDCGIVLPESTVSRYHCLLDINPPTVKLQDFGSLNGTYSTARRSGSGGATSHGRRPRASGMRNLSCTTAT